MDTSEPNYTFGNSKCAIELYKMIQDDEKAMKKVGNFLKHYFFIINNINSIGDERSKVPLLNSWKFTNVQIWKDNYIYLDKGVKTRVNNLIIAKYRESIKKVKI